MPRIRSESIPSNGVIDFIVILDSDPEKRFDVALATPDPNISGNVYFEYDVTNIDVGNHNIRIGADNGWETTWGTPDPLAFTRPVPVPMFGISLVLG